MAKLSTQWIIEFINTSVDVDEVAPVMLLLEKLKAYSFEEANNGGVTKRFPYYELKLELRARAHTETVRLRDADYKAFAMKLSAMCLGFTRIVRGQPTLVRLARGYKRLS